MRSTQPSASLCIGGGDHVVSHVCLLAYHLWPYRQHLRLHHAGITLPQPLPQAGGGLKAGEDSGEGLLLLLLLLLPLAGEGWDGGGLLLPLAGEGWDGGGDSFSRLRGKVGMGGGGGVCR